MSGLSPIRLNRRTLKRAATVALGLSLVLALAVVLSCWYLGIHSRMDALAYRCMIRVYFHPIWKDLALRRIRKGDDIESLMKRHPPAQRSDYGPYTHLQYVAPGSSNTIWALARDGKLVAAHADGHGWQHFFFQTPGEWEAFGTACNAYWQQKRLEAGAFQIHRVIESGQEVFLARLIERRETRGGIDLALSKEEMKQYAEIYGADYLDAFTTRRELIVEVTEVLCGDLQVGAMLTLPSNNCDHALTQDPEPVFLHVEDSRLIYSHSEGGEMYLAVPRKVLDWYQSLTEDQVREFEARCLAELARRAR